MVNNYETRSETMTKAIIFLTAVLALAGCAFGPTGYDLTNDGKNTDNVLTYDE